MEYANYSILGFEMLNKIVFKDDYLVFKKGEEYTFKPNDVNLIVGDQGTGKSTILNIFKDGKEKYDTVATVDGEACDFYYLDFEKNNPRMASRFEHAFQIASRFESHGEVNIQIFKKIVDEKFDNPVLVMVDEVDMALSIRSCYNLVKMLKKLRRNNHQVLAVVHNPIVIGSFKEVLSLEHKKWMSSKEFIASHTPKKKGEMEWP